MNHNIIYILCDLNYFKLHELALMREISHEHYKCSKYINFNTLKMHNLINKALIRFPTTISSRSFYFKYKKNFSHNQYKYIDILTKSKQKSINFIKFFSSFIFNNYYNIKKYDEFYFLNNNPIKIMIIKNDKFCCLKKYSGCDYINKRRQIETNIQLQSLLDFISLSQTHPIRKYELD